MDFINKTYVLIAVVAFFTNFASCNKNFPSTIERCKNEDKTCLKNAWNKYIRMSAPNGIQELDVPNLHNYFIAKATISPGSGPLDIVLKLRNFNLTGLDSLVLDKIVGFPRDPKKMAKFELIGVAPMVQVKGKYNVKGKVLLLPVVGDSNAEVTFYNIRANITAITATKVVDGEEYLVISNVHASYTTKRNTYRFDDIFNNKEISDSINNILNENQDIINNEIRVPIGNVLAEHFKKFFVAAFEKYPYRSFFLGT